MNELRVLPVTREQLSLWAPMREALYSDLEPAFHQEEMESLLASDEAECFLVWEGDEVVGMLELSLRNFVDGCVGGPVGYIEGIYLRPEHRGGGRGRRLIEFAAEWARSRGCTDLATDAEIDNVEAQEFYRRAGFAERWRTVGFTLSLESRSPDDS
ncbi:MAG: GNAT family N-acetyltransferase [Planctomycetota bacterium]